ncbi:MAG: amidohydrolase family protein [Bacteroidota bacterium]
MKPLYLQGCCLLVGLLCVSLSFGQGRSSGQTQLRPVTETVAITGATVVIAPGNVLEAGTVLIKDGLIQAVGKNVSIPGEARVVKADSMYVYAGFIDGLSHIGVPKPKAEENGNRRRGRSRSDSANPPNEDAGIQPERSVEEVLDPTDKSVKDFRSAGFTAAMVAPRGNMLPGTGSVVVLNGKQAADMILREDKAMFAQLKGASGVYPNTVIGVMAKFRELYRQATYASQHEQAYQADPVGKKRPAFDQATQAMYPVTAGEQPVIFLAPNAVDVYRSLQLQKDLDFPLMLGNVKQGTEVMEKLATAQVPVFLTLDLPKKAKEAKGKKKEEVSEEKKALEARKAEAYKTACSQAAKFAEAGMPFGFSTAGVGAKNVRANLRTMIEHGLTEDQALAALTTQPAELLGLAPMMGTVESGKMANLVISDQSFFAEKANVRYVMVEGELFEMPKPKAKKKGDASVKVQAAGAWSYTVETPQGSSGGTIVIKGSPDDLTGTLTNEMGEEEIELSGVELNGNELSFSFNFDAGGEMLNIQATGIIDGSSMEGNMSLGAFGDAPFEAERTGDPE